MKKTIRLSIIIPVYNEEKTILEIFEKVKRTKATYDPNMNVEKEIVIVDDGSSDQTPLILKNISSKNKIKLICHKKNMGKGAAVSSGLKNCTGDVIIIQDADLEYDPIDYKRLIGPIINGESSVIYGTRIRLKVSPEFYISLLGNKILTLFTNIIYGTKLTDVFVGYKAFTRRAINKIKLNSRGFEIEIELTAKFIKNGFLIKEIPISYHGRTWSEGKKISIKDGLMAFWCIFKYKFKD